MSHNIVLEERIWRLYYYRKRVCLHSRNEVFIYILKTIKSSLSLFSLACGFPTDVNVPCFISKKLYDRLVEFILWRIKYFGYNLDSVDGICCYDTVRRITRAVGVIIHMIHSSRQITTRITPCISSRILVIKTLSFSLNNI